MRRFSCGKTDIAGRKLISRMVREGILRLVVPKSPADKHLDKASESRTRKARLKREEWKAMRPRRHNLIIDCSGTTPKQTQLPRRL
jgi:hypothetical protein